MPQEGVDIWPMLYLCGKNMNVFTFEIVFDYSVKSVMTSTMPAVSKTIPFYDCAFEQT